MGAKSKKAKPKPAKKNGVALTLIRQGIGREDYTLPEGATLADLLGQARACADDQTVMINGRPIEEFVSLSPGAIVTLVPRPKLAVDERWRSTFGMFKDDPLFQEMVDAGKAIREADREAARRQAEDEEA
jgi:hypothetical protein